MISWEGKKEWFLIRSKEGMILWDGKKGMISWQWEYQYSFDKKEEKRNDFISRKIKNDFIWETKRMILWEVK